MAQCNQLTSGLFEGKINPADYVSIRMTSSLVVFRTLDVTGCWRLTDDGFVGLLQVHYSRLCGAHNADLKYS